MKTRHFVSFAAGFTLAIAVGAYAQSGYPTRPRFLSFGVNAAAPTTNGNATIAGTATAGALATTGSFPSVSMSSSDPGFNLIDTDAGADAKRWRTIAQGNVYSLQTRTDADGAGATPVVITRNGAAVSSIDYTASSAIQNIAPIVEQTLANAGAGVISRVTNSSGSLSSYALLDVRTTNTSKGVSLCVAIGAGTCVTGDASGDGALRSTGAINLSADNGTTKHFAVTPTAITGIGGVDMTPATGSFTASYTNACSTTPTQTVKWYKIGNLVTLTASPAFTCAADTVTFDTDASDVPAEIRPLSGFTHSAGFGAQNNSASATAMIEINAGEIVVNRCGAVTGTCDGGVWSSSGTRGLDSWTMSYVR